jgi:hypothetical protein
LQQLTLEAPRRGLSTLVRLVGAAHDPVRRVSFEGLTFRHAEPTTMRQYMVPSCGDWSIFRGGAVMVDGGAEQLSFHQNVFDSLGGNSPGR